MKEDEVFIRKEDFEDDEDCAYCLHGLCADVCKECLLDLLENIKRR